MELSKQEMDKMKLEATQQAKETKSKLVTMTRTIGDGIMQQDYEFKFDDNYNITGYQCFKRANY